MKYTLYLFITYLCMPMIAIAIAVSDLPISEASPANIAAYSDFNWDHVYNYKNSSAVAVHDNWLITAAHVADDGADGSLIVQGEVYTQMQQVYHPDADLALIRYDKAFPGFYPRVNSVPVGSEVVIVGFGRPGNVVSTFSQGYFTETGLDRSTKRWGTNKIDMEDTYNTTTPIISTNQGFQISISRSPVFYNPTIYEAGCNIGDSGCGIFTKQGGIWKLVGHLIGRYGISLTQFTQNIAVSISHYKDWINNVINNEDSDGDGMPDHFEVSYGAGSDLQAAADEDGDGMSNLEEWIADTDPTDTTSYLRLLTNSTPSLLRFTSAASREYQLQFSTNLIEGTWVDTNVWEQGQSSVTEQPSPIDEPLRFNRIGVRIP